jgi:hypothetical protein
MKKKGRLDLSFIVKGFQHLARVGESLEWADEFWTGDGRFFT